MNSAQIIARVTESLYGHQRQCLNRHKQHLSLIIDLKQCAIHQFNTQDSQYFYASPERGEYWVGYGSYLHLTAQGEHRFQDLNRQFEKALQQWVLPQPLDFPMAFVSFAFDPQDPMQDAWEGFANSELLIPQLMLHLTPTQSRLIIHLSLQNQQVDEPPQWDDYLQQLNTILTPQPEEKPRKQSIFPLNKRSKIGDKSIWMDGVSQAIHRIKQGQVNKLVPSRHVRLQTPQKISSAQLSKRLQQKFPNCHILSMSKQNRHLIAASPEQLLKTNGNTVQCSAIGGTLKRSKEQSVDHLFTERLLTAPSLAAPLSPPPLSTAPLSTESHPNLEKLRYEHAIIVEHIDHVLEQFCQATKHPDVPELMKLNHLLHLKTPIEGQLKVPTSALLLVEQLHPTPAVAGFPIAPALNWLKQYESHQRGLYSGAMGWLTATGAGEFSVILRCAVLTEADADKHQVKQNPGRESDEKDELNWIDLYAGAGIVEDSSPEEEWQETELKLETILGVLS